MNSVYRTTIGTYSKAQYHRDPESFGGHTEDACADDPLPPDEPGEWVLIGTAAADGMLFWTWKLSSAGGVEP